MRAFTAFFLAMLFLFCYACGPAEQPSPTATPAVSNTPSAEPEPPPPQTDPDNADTGTDYLPDDDDERERYESWLAGEPFDEAGETLLPESIVWLSRYTMPLGHTGSGREVILRLCTDYTNEWWLVLGENAGEGWTAGPEGAGIDMETAEYLSESLLENQWVVPVGGYAITKESVVHLGDAMSYAEAEAEDGYSGHMRLILAYYFGDGGTVGWFPLVYDSGSGWTAIEG